MISPEATLVGGASPAIPYPSFLISRFPMPQPLSPVNDKWCVISRNPTFLLTQLEKGQTRQIRWDRCTKSVEQGESI